MIKKNKNKSYYAAYSRNSENILFHKQIMGNEITHHVNGYPMDNRRCNLQVTMFDNDIIEIKSAYLEAKKKAYEWCLQIIKKYKINPMIDISFSISFHYKENVWRSYIKMKGNMIMKTFPIFNDIKPIVMDKHHDFDKLKSEFETIMIDNGYGFNWI